MAAPVHPPIRLQWPAAQPIAWQPDAAQRAVIEHERGHLRVLAGPGTGKTSVIVAAVRARLERGEPAGSMLVLTYGRMAAQELRTRLTVDALAVPVATTFHALARRLLFSGDPRLRLLGAPEQESVLHEIVRVSEHLPTEFEAARDSRGLTDQMRAFIASAQARGLGPGDLDDQDPLARAAGRVYGEYLDVMGLAGTLDYAELIRQARQLLATDPPASVRALRTIFVDEYQDTDPAQVRLLQQLAAHGAQVIAVGDPDQSIYGFRGADAAGLLQFDEVFALPSCTTIALGTTRRYGAELAEVAARVVPRNALGSIGVEQTKQHRAPQAAGPPGAAAFRVYETEAAQADHIADLLRRVHAGSSEVFADRQLQWSQMAVLVRSGSRDLPAFQRALTAAGIPVQIPQDDIPVFRSPAVRPLLDVLKAAADCDGGLTGQRAVDLLQSPLVGLESRQVTQLGRLLRRQAAVGGRTPAPSSELIASAVLDPGLLAGLPEALAEPAGRLGFVVEQTRLAILAGQPASALLDLVWNATPWPRRLRREALGGGRRAREANVVLDAVMELFAQAERSDDAFEQVRPVAEFLAQLADQAIPAAPDQQRPVGREAVALLTAHRAKGSQWPLVVIAGVQEGLWPDLRPRPALLTGGVDEGWRAQQLLDERRLFFVACTRAQEALLVCAVKSSAEDGPQPSPFLSLAAGPQPIVEVPGRPRRPLTPTGVVAGLREILADPASSPALRQAVWERLLDLGDRRDDQGRRVFPWADPRRWWGSREWTHNDRPWLAPDEPLALSASGVESYVRCPRQWFLERRAKAGAPASTRMAFGSLLHLCAEAVAGGELAPDEQEIADVLDQVWTAIGYAPGWQERFEREEAQRATRRLLTWMKNTPGEFVAAEREFEVDVELDGGEQATLGGKIDRIDRVGEQLVITDFKTGRPITHNAAAAHIQLGLYRWISELGGLGVPQDAIAQLVYVRHDPPAKAADTGAKTLTQDSPDVAEWVQPVLDAVTAGIRAQQAPARPGDHCRNCALITSCPARPEGLEVRP